jgi:heavy metal sensor kinase
LRLCVRFPEIMFHSIRAKFTFWYIGSFVVVALLSLGLTEPLFEIFALNTIDQALSAAAKRLEPALLTCFPLEQYPQAEGLYECFDKTLRKLFVTDVIFAQLLSFPEDGTAPLILAQSYALQGKSLPLSPNAYQAVKKNIPLFETTKQQSSKLEKKLEIRLLTILINDPTKRAYILQFGIATAGDSELSSFLKPLTYRPHIFSTLFAILLVIIAPLGYIFMKKAFAPVHKVVTLAKQITAEDLSHRIDSVNSNDEIGELADTLNEMIARLERSFHQIKQFSGDVSHELKTPLTAIKGELEVALRKERNKEEYQDILASVLEKTNQLENIIADLLFLARMDAHSIPLTFTEFPLDELLLEVYEETYRLAEQKQITFNLKHVEQVNVMGDSGLIKRVLLNLIGNALKYTESGGTIELALERDTDTAIWTIRDTGIGIPAESLPSIFDRFYRVDQSRSHDTGGSGLGLAIVQKIVEAHHGKIEVASEVGKGTTFKVFLNGII